MVTRSGSPRGSSTTGESEEAAPEAPSAPRRLNANNCAGAAERGRSFSFVRRNANIRFSGGAATVGGAWTPNSWPAVMASAVIVARRERDARDDMMARPQAAARMPTSASTPPTSATAAYVISYARVPV